MVDISFKLNLKSAGYIPQTIIVDNLSVRLSIVVKFFCLAVFTYVHIYKQNYVDFKTITSLY